MTTYPYKVDLRRPQLKSYHAQRRTTRPILFVVTLAFASLTCDVCHAVSIREKIAERRLQQSDMTQEDAASWQGALPAGVKVIRDVAYGSHARQKFDVYLPQTPSADMPVILMVHGGAWSAGDKAARGVVLNKVRHWVPKGFIFISMNYRLLPETMPLQQADDVANALAAAQVQAASWRGDKNQFILMGHSAGAHLVSLLAAAPAISAKFAVLPWLGTIALDSAVYDLPKIMAAKHYRFYDSAFGDQASNWGLNSPLQLLNYAGAPFLAVCSSIRPDHPCQQAGRFVERAKTLGMQARLLPEALSHKDINEQLGAENTYTRAVDEFIASLHPAISLRLGKK